MVNIVSAYMPLLRVLMKLVGMKSREIELEPGTTLHFWAPIEPTNNPTKPAVVFLHGFGLNGILTWQFQVMALAKDYAVYVPDLLFFGGSTTRRNERSPEFQAECMAEGLRRLGVEKCTLVGLSYGGMVGFKMAEMFPDLVESMVVTCSVMALTESITQATLKRIGFSSWAEYLLPDSVKGSRDMLEIAMFKLGYWLPDFAYKDFLEVWYDKRKDKTQLLEALIVRDKDFSIPRFTQRIHLLWGENDKIFNMEVASLLNEQLEGKATLESIKEAGHLVPMERPRMYNSCLKLILSSSHHDPKKMK